MICSDKEALLQAEAEITNVIPSFNKDVSDFLIEAVHMLMMGFLDEHTTDELAKELYVSERHLRRAFNNELGISPNKAALNRRLVNAHRLMQQTDMKLIDIAYESGFQSLRSFNYAFKNVFNIAPSQIRNQLSS